MKIINKLIINDQLNPELVGLKCYAILNKSMDGMGLGGGYSVFKIKFLDYCNGYVRANTLSEVTGKVTDFMLCFNERNTHYNPIVICDNEPEAKNLAKLFSRYGYCSSKECIEKLDNQLRDLKYLRDLARELFEVSIWETNRSSFDPTRVDRDDKKRVDHIEYCKLHYPKYLTHLVNIKGRCKVPEGSAVYLTTIMDDGTAIYHCPDLFGCWDVTIGQTTSHQFIGVNNIPEYLNSEWVPISEKDFLNSYELPQGNNHMDYKLSQLTKGLYGSERAAVVLRNPDGTHEVVSIENDADEQRVINYIKEDGCELIKRCTSTPDADNYIDNNNLKRAY